MWEPGTLLECVDDAPHPDWAGGARSATDLDGLSKGCVYTVRRIVHDMYFRCDTVLLQEIVRPPYDNAFGTTLTEEPGYGVERFRPLSESRLSIFRSLLTETPKTVNVGEEA